MFKRPNKYALHSAVFEGNFSAVKELLAKRTSYTISDDNGATPMHVAAMQGYAKIIHLLKVHGAKFDEADSHGETPLHLAVKKGDYDSVKEIVMTSPRLDVQDRFGNTALHYAVEYGDEAIVRCLLEAGACPNFLNENHESPLCIAERSSKDEKQKLLLKFRAKKPMNFFKAFCKSFRIANFIRKAVISTFLIIFCISFIVAANTHGVALLPVFLCMVGIALGVSLVLLDRPYKIIRKIEAKLFNGQITNHDYELLMEGKVSGVSQYINEETNYVDPSKIVFIEQSTKYH